MNVPEISLRSLDFCLNGSRRTETSEPIPPGTETGHSEAFPDPGEAERSRRKQDVVNDHGTDSKTSGSV